MPHIAGGHAWIFSTLQVRKLSPPHSLRVADTGRKPPCVDLSVLSSILVDLGCLLYAWLSDNRASWEGRRNCGPPFTQLGCLSGELAVVWNPLIVE